MIFVRIDNISNRLYAGVFKICAKGFSVAAVFNNIYVITIKRVSQSFFIGDNIVLMNQNNDIVISLFPVKPLFARNGFMNFQKLLLVVKPFSVSFLR